MSYVSIREFTPYDGKDAVFYPLLGTISVLAACVPSASISALNNWEKTYDN